MILKDLLLELFQQHNIPIHCVDFAKPQHSTGPQYIIRIPNHMSHGIHSVTLDLTNTIRYQCPCLGARIKAYDIADPKSLDQLITDIKSHKLMPSDFELTFPCESIWLS